MSQTELYFRETLSFLSFHLNVFLVIVVHSYYFLDSSWCWKDDTEVVALGVVVAGFFVWYSQFHRTRIN
jgi:hypothetical protein